MEFVNNTPFPAICWPNTDSKENKHITILARVKYLFDTVDADGLWRLKFDQEQDSLFGADVFYDEKKRHVQYESDYVPYKRQGDLIINLSETKREFGKCGVEVYRYTLLAPEEAVSKRTLLKSMSLKNLDFVHRAEPQRVQYVGTVDAEWIEKHAPAFPKDFDERHYNAAHRDMQLPKTYFQPGDNIVLHKLLPGIHEQRVLIPGVFLKASVYQGARPHRMLLEADTVIFDIESIEMEQNCIYISYRHRLPLDSKVTKINLDMVLEKSFIEEGEETWQTT